LSLRTISFVLLILLPLFSGCGKFHRHGLEFARLHQAESAYTRHVRRLSPELEQRILALDPCHVTANDVQEVLSHAPAPRVINIHGGVTRVIPHMVSFSQFLIGLGYPAGSLTNPNDGTYSFSCYESSERIAGMIAWFYEKEGLRPMMVGHSQGGMQVVKVLDQLARKPASPLKVWSPLTWQPEDRYEIVDPLTGQRRPVVGLQLSYATVVGAGGITRVLPNQWDMTFRLHTIPDSVEEFTGFCKGWDFTGGDLLGYGSINYYRASGTAVVRNVWLPASYRHGTMPEAEHLLKDQRLVDWINEYHPSDEPVSRPRFDLSVDADTRNILWAADVWYSIKKHWVLELQRWIRAQASTRQAGVRSKEL
jgi:hypothetical protein